MVLMSTSGPLGRYISAAPPLTIWWRCFLAALIIGLFVWATRLDFKLKSKQDITRILLSGLFLGGHWVTYFYALQLSNVAIGMLSLFTYPMFTSLLEPLFYKTYFRRDHIILGAVVIVAIYFLAPSLSLKDSNTQGLLFGLLSSICYSVRNLIIKNQVMRYHGSVIMLFQMVVVTLFLTPTLLIYPIAPVYENWLPILGLALVTTSIGHTLFVVSFKYFSISTASIISSMQPVYGILLAIIFLEEYPELRAVLGGLLIISTVIYASFTSYKAN